MCFFFRPHLQNWDVSITLKHTLVRSVLNKKNLKSEPASTTFYTSSHIENIEVRSRLKVSQQG